MKGDLERVARECAEQWTSGRQHTEGYKIRLAEHIATALRRHGAAVLREAAERLPRKRGGGPVPKPPPDREFYANWLRARAGEE